MFTRIYFPILKCWHFSFKTNGKYWVHATMTYGVQAAMHIHVQIQFEIIHCQQRSWLSYVTSIQVWCRNAHTDWKNGIYIMIKHTCTYLHKNIHCLCIQCCKSRCNSPGCCGKLHYHDTYQCLQCTHSHLQFISHNVERNDVWLWSLHTSNECT